MERIDCSLYAADEIKWAVIISVNCNNCIIEDSLNDFVIKITYYDVEENGTIGDGGTSLLTNERIIFKVQR